MVASERVQLHHVFAKALQTHLPHTCSHRSICCSALCCELCTHAASGHSKNLHQTKRLVMEQRRFNFDFMTSFLCVPTWEAVQVMVARLGGVGVQSHVTTAQVLTPPFVCNKEFEKKFDRNICTSFNVIPSYKGENLMQYSDRSNYDPKRTV